MLKCFGIIILGGILFFSYFQETKSYSFSASHSARHRRESGDDDVECVLPNYPENGEWKVLPKSSAKPGDKIPDSSVIKFKCNPGYKLSTKNPLVLCDENWSSVTFPECEELCPPMYSSNLFQLSCFDKRGSATSCSAATHGTYMEYTCARFYETPFGYKKTIFCEDGKWNQEKPVCLPACGKKIADKAGQFIYGAKENDKLEYPWVAALYLNRTGDYENVCGGSILSPTVVLTAAHCVTNDYGEALPTEGIAIGAGKLYNKYQAPEDTHAQYLKLSKVIVHDEYKAHERRFTADLAILITDGEFVLNEVIQPVCVNGLKNVELRPNDIGEVSGWGITDGDLPSNVLRTLKIPYKTPDVCAKELPPEFNNRYNTIDKLCAGFYNKNQSVCSGDSGGGLAFRNFEDNRYYIHGIVSTGHLLMDRCNIQQNSLYTKVTQYYEFIDRIVSKYAPKVKDCVLPPYPKNGKWTIDNQDKKPKDAVTSTTILKVECNSGYKLSSTVDTIECRSAQNMPTCQKLCEPLGFPEGTFSTCTNKDGQVSNCLESVEGTTLWYTCPKGHKFPAGSLNKRTCKNGSWGTPKPECIKQIPNCGRKRSNTSIPAVDNGAPQPALEYPWSVSVRTSNKENHTYLCGATLISAKIVLTAASCVVDEFTNLATKEDFIVVLGNVFFTRNLDDLFYDSALLSQIIVHPDYEGAFNEDEGKMNEYKANLAILITDFVLNFEPACFFGLDFFHLQPEDVALMPGWKFQENVTYETREVVITEKKKCFPIKSTVTDYSDKQCSRFQNNKNCFKNDVGKGLYAQNPKDGRYYIYGIVSAKSESSEDTAVECDRNIPFTHVAYYYDFIAAVLLIN